MAVVHRSMLRWGEGHSVFRCDYSRGMCRNITPLRGLDPVATPEEVEAAARQYVRKVSAVAKTSPATVEAFERAVAEITKSTAALLAALPPRQNPPPTLPPLRRIAIRKAQQFAEAATAA